jgi:cysteinyl-tRNA synthetase
MISIYNTLTRKNEPLLPDAQKNFRMYVCGLTPSAEPHLGHARSFHTFDVLRRYLEHPRNGCHVTFVQNVTDIDDRAIATANEQGIELATVVEKYYTSFTNSMDKLGIAKADIVPRATQTIPEILTFIEKLLEKGCAYIAEDAIYFSIQRLNTHGKLSHKDFSQLLAGASERITTSTDKKDPLDFALWKFAKPGEPQWNSPWGAGRPGWHIECSAMIYKNLGETIDLHGGGQDLIFPHHENEIAQSESVTGRPLARVWMHTGMLMKDGNKLAKSRGNYEPLSTLLERYEAQAIRFLFLQTGYSRPMNYTEHSLQSAARGLETLRKRYDEARTNCDKGIQQARTFLEPIYARLDDNLDTAGALGGIFTCLEHIPELHHDEKPLALGEIKEICAILGLTIERQHIITIDRYALHSALGIRDSGEELGNIIDEAIRQRAQARLAKDWARSDAIRENLARVGVLLEDRKDSTTWSIQPHTSQTLER